MTMLTGNPYAMQDRAQAERDAEADAFTDWCEREGIEDPTDADLDRYHEERAEAEQAYWESIAEDSAEHRAEGDYY